MSEFYDTELFEADFHFLVDLKTILIEELLRWKQEWTDLNIHDEAVKKGYFTETDDGRQVRIILPRGIQNALNYLKADDIKEGSEICFVGFFGTKRDNPKPAEEIVKEIWSLDDIVAGELSAFDGMIAYVSGEVETGGNWANFVAIRDKRVIQDLSHSSNHARASKVVAPNYYSSARIHSGKLLDGLPSKYFSLQKTLFINFLLPEDDLLRRRFQNWRSTRQDSAYVKVLQPTSEKV